MAAQSAGATGNFGAGHVFRGNFFGGTGAGARGGSYYTPGAAGARGLGGTGWYGPGYVNPGFGAGVPWWTRSRLGSGYRFNQSGQPYPYGYGTGFPGLYGYGAGYYYGRFWQGANQQDVPTGPSFANPAPIQAPAEVAAPLEAPAMPDSVASTDKADFGDLQSRFTLASVKVTSARQAVEEMRARLASIGQTPRAETLSRLTLAEAALSQAQQRLAAGDLAQARDEIRRADYVAQQVLKEFGR